MLYARDAWYVAAWSHELDQSKPNAVMILGEPITIWRSKGEWIAMEDRCPHRFAPLSLGRCEDDHLRCMYHGLVFDKNGICLKVPGQDNVPEKMRVQTYQVREKDGWIWIWMGKSESADDTIIPDVIGPNNPDYYISTGTLDYEAEAFLISRNLLDFSHVPFVHEASFGTPREMAELLPQWQHTVGGLAYTLWTRNVLGSPSAPSSVPIDDMLGYDYLVPGIMRLESGHFPVGTADKYKDGRPNFSEAVGAVISSSQAVTPVDEKKARYFFTIGPRKDFGSEAQLAGLTEIQLKAGR
jgi:vanillate O-demethylase monooxygenase subunit